MFYGLLDHLSLFLFGDLVCFHVDELDDSVQIVHDLLSVFFVVIHDGSSFSSILCGDTIGRREFSDFHLPVVSC